MLLFFFEKQKEEKERSCINVKMIMGVKIVVIKQADHMGIKKNFKLINSVLKPILLDIYS